MDSNEPQDDFAELLRAAGLDANEADEVEDIRRRSERAADALRAAIVE